MKVTVHELGTTVVLGCGLVVEGRPQGSDHQTDIARELGYGADTLQMCKDHDALHVALCHWLGIKESFALLTVVGLLPKNDEVAGAEEAAVLAIQKFMRLAEGRMPI